MKRSRFGHGVRAASARALVIGIVLGIALAAADPSWARPGLGGSIGSRGSRTYAPPPRTATTPYGAAPFGRPSAARPYAYGGYGGYGGAAAVNRHPFASGLVGGLLGAGLAGLLIGHGMFGGLHGGAGLLGLLLQIVALVLIVRWIVRRVGGGPAAGVMREAGAGAARPSIGAAPFGAPPSGLPGVAIGRADYAAFEGILKEVQRAWTMGDVAALGRVATPEMVGILNAQLQDLARRGLRNAVSDVRMQQGDLAEAWREGVYSYATVGIRYAMIDVTTDGSGRVVEGSPAEHVEITEYWTFVRRDGFGWILSAIQQS